MLENISQTEFLLAGKACTQLNFTLDGAFGLLVQPQKPARGRPWVWRAEFFDIFAAADHALLEKGWHIAYYSQSDRYGSPGAVESMKRFHDALVSELALSPKADMFGFSRGGLYAANYAAKYPGDIAVLYLDAPVLSIKNWPAGLNGNPREPNEWIKCQREYGLTEETVASFHDDPLDKLPQLCGVKVLLVAGLADEVVYYENNGARLVAYLKQNGGDITTILKPGCLHWPHSLSRPTPIVRRIQKERRRLNKANK